LLPLLLLSLLQLRSPDTLKLGPLNEGIAGNVAPDAQLLGPPQVQFRTGQGSVSVWLLIRRDTVLIAANIQDSTPTGATTSLSASTVGETVGRVRSTMVFPTDARQSCWFSYPQPKPGEPATAVEQTPERWIPLQPLSVPR
jgi:hypothetical protein